MHVKNLRERVALFLCFTPPTSTYTGMDIGIISMGVGMGMAHGFELYVDMISIMLCLGLKYGLDEDGNILAQKPEDIQRDSKFTIRTLYTVHHIPYTIYHAPYTIHHTPYTIHHTPY
ncbi:hypothetical protein EON63_05980 [archaeon]|nr:MAG: hypothetical protein EON63_05980 [archaeon]